jgi:hypothetical protein
MAIKGGATGAAEAALQLFFNADNLTVEKISGIAEKVKALAKNLQVESDRVRTFKVDIHWKSRVIHVPRAITATKKLLRDMTTGLKEKVKDLAAPFEEFAHNLKLESFTEDPLGGGQTKIASAFDQLSHFITELNILVGAVDNGLDKAGELTDLFDQVINEIEHLDTFFLPQNSQRNKTTLTYFKRS